MGMECSLPGHTGPKAKVVKAGWYGKEPHRRQLWQCKPANGDPVHRFAGVLPRQEAKAGSCTECEAIIETWEGPQTARLYGFTTREVARALVFAASGVSYRQAADKTRTQAHRRRPPSQSRNSEHPNRHGQLVANWVEVFAPVIWAAYTPTSWPEWLVMDAVPFEVKAKPPGMSSKSKIEAFTVLAVVGYERPGAPSKAWWLQTCRTETQAAWRGVFSQLPGTPKLVVSDDTQKAIPAVGASFPRPGDPAPEVRLCEWHLRRNVAEKLPDSIVPPRRFSVSVEERATPAERHHPIRVALDSAFNTPTTWAQFERLVRDEAALTGGLTGAVHWFDLHSQKVAQQIANRAPHGPRSVGPVEELIRKVKRNLGYRSSNFGNKARTNSLLRLMTLEHNGDADERAWAEFIRAHLHSHGGRPTDQRLHDDPAGTKSIRT